MTHICIGCIADDFTGASDLANNLARTGMRVMQTIGVPAGPLTGEIDAVVVALKSRSSAPPDAVAQSLAALAWLQKHGAQQIYFKYCSTFDSTATGNIGPVIDALMSALGTDFTIATPAFPDNQRTVFKGYLFVGDALLNESGMQNHPLTPMTDANLVRVLQAQTVRKVGLIDYAVVARGADAVKARIAVLKSAGVGIAMVDAISNDDLMRLGPALQGMALVTAGSGVALGLAQNFAASANLADLAKLSSTTASTAASKLPAAAGFQAVVSGSCSSATHTQVQAFVAAGWPARALDPLRIASGIDEAGEVLAWATPLLQCGPVLVYSTAQSAVVKAVQQHLGVNQAGALVERTLAAIAAGLVARGVRQLIVAGGETSGACVQALGITQLQIGPQIAPGVPWTYCEPSLPGAPSAHGGLHITMKSGNFGGPEFFTDAFKMLA